MTSESSVLDTLKIFVQVYNSGSENFLFRRKKIVRCFVHFMDFSRESGEACAERRSSIHYAFIMRAEKGVLRYLKSREEAAAKGSKTQKKNAGTKKKHHQRKQSEYFNSSFHDGVLLLQNNRRPPRR